MPWFKVDDTLHSHPKARRAGLQGVGLWTLAGSFSMAYKTDGGVPDYFTEGFGRQGKTAAELLTRAGLWVPDGSGFQFHDWVDYQPTADEIEADREHARERQRKRRERLRKTREEGDAA